MYVVLEAMGLRVIEVAALDPPVLYLDDHDLALISQDLSPAQRLRVVDALLLMRAQEGRR